MMFDILYVMGFAAALSLAVSGFMVFAGLGDIPEARSNHKTTTPTGGGLGLAAGVGGLFLLLPQTFPPAWISGDLPLILSILWAVALLGLLDDVYTLPSLFKFIVLLGLAGLAVLVIGPVQNLPYARSGLELPYWAGFLGSVLWVFVVANAVNFMDGANGLMASVMAVACLALAVIAVLFSAFQVIWIPAALAAGLLGFLPYNMRNKARIFCGDVGSLFVGFGFAISVLWLCSAAPSKLPVYIGPVLILPFLTDVLLTMLRRAKHKENLLQAHNSHLYHRMTSYGLSHMKIAALYLAAGVVMAVYTLIMTRMGHHTFTIFMTLPAFVLGCIYYAVSRKVS